MTLSTVPRSPLGLGAGELVLLVQRMIETNASTSSVESLIGILPIAGHPPSRRGWDQWR